MKKITFLLIAFSISLSVFAQDSGDLENQFYFRFGYSSPTSSYLALSDNPLWVQDKKGGGTFEIGQIFMLNSIPLSDGLRLGINADYAEISYNQISSLDETIGVFKVASKVGPSISYSPINDLVFDVFIKAKISWVAGLAIAEGGTVNDDGYAGLAGFGFSTGFNIRYRFLMAGIEFNKDSMKLEYSEFSEIYFGNLVNGDDKSPMPSVSFTFGFSF